MATDKILTEMDVKQIVEEIQDEAEKSRRAMAKRRQDIYNDGGKAFLIEQVKREFNEDAVKEMRLAPINVLKKIVTKKASIYKTPAIRTSEQNQDLVDYYTQELRMDMTMMKGHKYYHLHSNAAIYVIPDPDAKIKVCIVPPYLYSIKANQTDRTKIDTWIFNAFTEEGSITPDKDLQSATGSEGFSREYGKEKGLVDSQEKEMDAHRQYIFWNDFQHFTTADNADIYKDQTKDETQFLNPIGIAPVVNLAKDRDNEPWATQGEDLIDLSMAVQIGWSDILTIAKHQAFALLTVISEEQPQKLTIGVNRAIWLKQRQDGPAPSISYVQANSPLGEYKDLLLDLLALLLSTNDMPVNAVGGVNSVKQFNSGFQALIEMSDTLEVVEQDKPVMRDAEKATWELIKRWHNYLFDANVLHEDARALGKFAEDFEINIQYRDIKPIESERETIDAVKTLRELGLISKLDAMKKLNPDLQESQIEEKLLAIKDETKKEVDDINKDLNFGEPDEGSVQV